VDRIRYARRLSGPLLDRIDLVCELSQPPPPELVRGERSAESSSEVRERVVAARAIQIERLSEDGLHCNGAMDARLTHQRIRVSTASAARGRLECLSGRGQDRVLRLARTIADLAGSEEVATDHLDEALGFRMTDPLRAVA
jgi:magnesium chelatase family protein